jgi:hypothetical protein
VYASELAPPGWEGRHGAFMVGSCQAGLLAGEVAVMIGECRGQGARGWQPPQLQPGGKEPNRASGKGQGPLSGGRA